jgi:hypothetical protein
MAKSEDLVPTSVLKCTALDPKGRDRAHALSTAKP